MQIGHTFARAARVPAVAGAQIFAEARPKPQCVRVSYRTLDLFLGDDATWIDERDDIATTQPTRSNERT